MPAVPVTVPSVGESITEGILSRWLKADGSSVQAGEPLFELETDKVSSDVPASSSGVLKIDVEEGAKVAIGSTVGTIDPAVTVKASPAAEAPETRSAAGSAAIRPLSPAVRRLVAEQDVDLAHVAATGPGGRVTKGDVLAFIESAGPKSAPEPDPASAPGARVSSAAASSAAGVPGATGPRETRRRMSGLRERIAQRLVEVQQTAAILTTFNEADMSRVIELRNLYKEPFQKRHGIALGFSSFFIKAAIDALKAFPAVNAGIEGNEIVYHNFYDIGMAVSTERGLMVPVVRDADRISFAAIEKAVADFAARARQGTIAVDDLQGGTFTITNGGVFGSLLSTPILNPPQSAILGMHAIKKRPIVVDDQVAIRPMMYLALSYDHRLIDGREAVGFLVRVKDCIEDPERLMLEV
ncbi:MAG: 2-oxoglutarate dehydrogenase complex dihydrolipoyllysine-residue succinyltransferase [Isosphaerales bacterium]